MYYYVESCEWYQVVIVDIGGGIIDIVYVEVGGDDVLCIYCVWGIVRGGIDIDLVLSLFSYMLLFGRGIICVFVYYYVEVVIVQDMICQCDFCQYKYDYVDNLWGVCLQVLQDIGNIVCLYCDVECVKIVFSVVSEYCSMLDYIVCDLYVDSSVDGLVVVVYGYLEQIWELLVQVCSDIGGDLDVVFLIGGMFCVGYLCQVVVEVFLGVCMVYGEFLLGVVQGFVLVVVSQD